MTSVSSAMTLKAFLLRSSNSVQFLYSLLVESNWPNLHASPRHWFQSPPPLTRVGLAMLTAWTWWQTTPLITLSRHVQSNKCTQTMQEEHCKRQAQGDDEIRRTK